MDPRGLHKNSKKVDERGCMQKFMIEQGKPVVFGLRIKPQTNGFHDFSVLLQIDRLQLTAVYCNRRECKDNTSRDPFSQCELYKEFAYRSKLSKWFQRQELKLTTRSTERNPTMCEVT